MSPSVAMHAKVENNVFKDCNESQKYVSRESKRPTQTHRTFNQVKGKTVEVKHDNFQ